MAVLCLSLGIAPQAMRSLSHEAFYRRLPCLLRHGEQRFSILIRNGWICSVFKQDAHKVCVAVVGGPHGWSHVNRCSGWGARVHLGPRSKERTQCAEVATNGGGVECGLAILAALPHINARIEETLDLIAVALSSCKYQRKRGTVGVVVAQHGHGAAHEQDSEKQAASHQICDLLPRSVWVWVWV